MNFHQALHILYPNAIHTVGNVAYDASGNEVTYNKSEVDAYVAAHAYKEKRVAEYPPIGDQLDALFKAGVFPADMAAKIQAVKDKYPKA